MLSVTHLCPECPRPPEAFRPLTLPCVIAAQFLLLSNPQGSPGSEEWGAQFWEGPCVSSLFLSLKNSYCMLHFLGLSLSSIFVVVISSFVLFSAWFLQPLLNFPVLKVSVVCSKYAYVLFSVLCIVFKTTFWSWLRGSASSCMSLHYVSSVRTSGHFVSLYPACSGTSVCFVYFLISWGSFHASGVEEELKSKWGMFCACPAPLPASLRWCLMPYWLRTYIYIYCIAQSVL